MPIVYIFISVDYQLFIMGCIDGWNTFTENVFNMINKLLLHSVFALLLFLLIFFPVFPWSNIHFFQKSFGEVERIEEAESESNFFYL